MIELTKGYIKIKTNDDLLYVSWCNDLLGNYGLAY